MADLFWSVKLFVLQLERGDVRPGLVQLVRDVVQLCLVQVHSRDLQRDSEIRTSWTWLWLFQAWALKTMIDSKVVKNIFRNNHLALLI